MQAVHRKQLRVVELVRCLFMFKIVAMVYLLSLAISWFPIWSLNDIQPTEIKNSSLKLKSILHHRDSDTHRKQMELSSNKIRNLYEIMNIQLTGFTKGKFEEKPYKKILYWNTMRNFPPSRQNSIMELVLVMIGSFIIYSSTRYFQMKERNKYLG